MDQNELQHERAQLLNNWARFAAEHLQKSLKKKHVGITGDLDYSILYALKGIAGGDVSSVIHMFNYYGKFVDMGVGRGQKIEDVKSNGDMIRLLGGGRRPKKWFSPTYYNQVNVLLNLMAEKYGEQGTHLIKETISIIAA